MCQSLWSSQTVRFFPEISSMIGFKYQYRYRNQYGEVGRPDSGNNKNTFN